MLEKADMIQERPVFLSDREVPNKNFHFVWERQNGKLKSSFIEDIEIQILLL